MSGASLQSACCCRLAATRSLAEEDGGEEEEEEGTMTWVCSPCVHVGAMIRFGECACACTSFGADRRVTLSTDRQEGARVDDAETV